MADAIGSAGSLRRVTFIRKVAPLNVGIYFHDWRNRGHAKYTDLAFAYVCNWKNVYIQPLLSDKDTLENNGRTKLMKSEMEKHDYSDRGDGRGRLIEHAVNELHPRANRRGMKNDIWRDFRRFAAKWKY